MRRAYRNKIGNRGGEDRHHRAFERKGRFGRGLGCRRPADASGVDRSQFPNPAPGDRVRYQGPAGSAYVRDRHPLPGQAAAQSWVRDCVALRFRLEAARGPENYSPSRLRSAPETRHVGDYDEWRDLALVFNIVSVGRSTFISYVWLPPEVAVERKR